MTSPSSTTTTTPSSSFLLPPPPQVSSSPPSFGAEQDLTQHISNSNNRPFDPPHSQPNLHHHHLHQQQQLHQPFLLDHTTAPAASVGMRTQHSASTTHTTASSSDYSAIQTPYSQLAALPSPYLAQQQQQQQPASVAVAKSNNSAFLIPSSSPSTAAMMPPPPQGSSPSASTHHPDSSRSIDLDWDHRSSPPLTFASLGAWPASNPYGGFGYAPGVGGDGIINVPSDPYALDPGYGMQVGDMSFDFGMDLAALGEEDDGSVTWKPGQIPAATAAENAALNNTSSNTNSSANGGALASTHQKHASLSELFAHPPPPASTHSSPAAQTRSSPHLPAPPAAAASSSPISVPTPAAPSSPPTHTNLNAHDAYHLLVQMGGIPASEPGALHGMAPMDIAMGGAGGIPMSMPAGMMAMGSPSMGMTMMGQGMAASAHHGGFFAPGPSASSPPGTSVGNGNEQAFLSTSAPASGFHLQQQLAQQSHSLLAATASALANQPSPPSFSPHPHAQSPSQHTSPSLLAQQQQQQHQQALHHLHQQQQQQQQSTTPAFAPASLPLASSFTFASPFLGAASTSYGSSHQSYSGVGIAPSLIHHTPPPLPQHLHQSPSLMGIGAHNMNVDAGMSIGMGLDMGSGMGGMWDTGFHMDGVDDDFSLNPHTASMSRSNSNKDALGLALESSNGSGNGTMGRGRRMRRPTMRAAASAPLVSPTSPNFGFIRDGDHAWSHSLDRSGAMLGVARSGGDRDEVESNASTRHDEDEDDVFEQGLGLEFGEDGALEDGNDDDDEDQDEDEEDDDVEEDDDDDEEYQPGRVRSRAGHNNGSRSRSRKTSSSHSHSSADPHNRLPSLIPTNSSSSGHRRGSSSAAAATGGISASAPAHSHPGSSLSSLFAPSARAQAQAHARNASASHASPSSSSPGNPSRRGTIRGVGALGLGGKARPTTTTTTATTGPTAGITIHTANGITYASLPPSSAPTSATSATGPTTSPAYANLLSSSAALNSMAAGGSTGSGSGSGTVKRSRGRQVPTVQLFDLPPPGLGRSVSAGGAGSGGASGSGAKSIPMPTRSSRRRSYQMAYEEDEDAIDEDGAGMLGGGVPSSVDAASAAGQESADETTSEQDREGGTSASNSSASRSRSLRASTRNTRRKVKASTSIATLHPNASSSAGGYDGTPSSSTSDFQPPPGSVIVGGVVPSLALSVPGSSSSVPDAGGALGGGAGGSGAGGVAMSWSDGRTRSYVCRVGGCGKCFQRGEHLKRHIRSIHTNDKPFKCTHPGCNKDFSRRDNLLQHMTIHSRYQK